MMNGENQLTMPPLTAPATKIPSLIYGTAWKAEQTADLVKQALLSGFRGVDTAAQPKHYNEPLVGAGIRASKIPRSELYIQTKFTSIGGQDPKKGMPYDPRSSIADQVHASVASSLKNLRPADDEESAAESYIDCLVLHSPFPTMAQTKEAWRAMESHVPRSVRTLGVSNCYNLAVIEELYASAAVKPSVVQNRFYAETEYDLDVRRYCDERAINYQSFWTLTANPHLLRSAPVGALAEKAGVSRPVALYGLVLGLGNISVLNGTKTKQRMEEDLAGVEVIRRWSETNMKMWKQIQESFMTLGVTCVKPRAS